MHFSNLICQKSYEKIIYTLRRHWFTFLPKISLFLLLLLSPLALYYIISTLFPNLLAEERIYTVAILAASAYYLTIYLLFLTQFIDYYLDIWIVTNDRIVDIEQFGLFSRTISELDLFRIQDVTTDVHGVFPTLLGYGNVSVKTASQNIDIVFYNVPDPNLIRHELLKLADADRKYHYPETTDKGVNEM